jgi:hypothetical protein
LVIDISYPLGGHALLTSRGLELSSNLLVRGNGEWCQLLFFYVPDDLCLSTITKTALM